MAGEQTEQTPGQRAVAAALGEWQKLISARPECFPRLSEYLRAAGERRPYPAPQDGRPYQWCGAFAAWCWIHGAGMRPDLGSSWASTYRLVRLFGQYQRDKNIHTPSLVLGDGGRLDHLLDYHEQHGGRRVALAGRKPLRGVVRVGDVATVGKGAWGSHIVLIAGELEDGSGIATVSGNGFGYWPGEYDRPLSTRKVSGVVVADVPWASVAFVIRPAPADLDRDLILRRQP